MTKFGEWRRSRFAPEITALLLWLVFAWLQIGYDSPDEHFPTLEAAGSLLFGRFESTWEWHFGMRSWLQPALLAAWLKPFVVLGVEDRIVLDHLARTLLAFLSPFLVSALGSIARSVLGSTEEEVLLVRWRGALAWPLILWGTRHGSDAFVIPFLFAGLSIVLSPRAGKAWASFGGFLLGISFLIRFPSSLVIGAALVFGFQFWRTRSKQVILGFFLSVFVGCTLDAFIYWRWLGHAAWPAWEFFRFNILQGSGAFHVSPWWEPFLYLLFLWSPPFVWVYAGGWKPFSKNMRIRAVFARVQWPFAVIIFTTLSFALIKHHEFRFLLPLIPFTLLASIPWSRTRFEVVVNLVFLAVCAVFYAEPHGNLVRAFNRGTSDPGGYTFFVHEVAGTLPTFYSRLANHRFSMSPEAFQAECEGGARKERGPFLILTTKTCLNPKCVETVREESGWFERIRDRIRHRESRSIRIYRCHPELSVEPTTS